MSSFLTQCPHCLTSFRVTDRQLDAAEGLVRCGACLGIFSADANRITVKPTPDEAAAAGAHAPDEFDDDEDAEAALEAEAREERDDTSAFEIPDDFDEADELDDQDEREDHGELDEQDELDARDADDEAPDSAEEAHDEPVPPARMAQAIDTDDDDLLSPEDNFDIPLGDLNLDIDIDEDDESDDVNLVEDEEEHEEEDEYEEEDAPGDLDDPEAEDEDAPEDRDDPEEDGAEPEAAAGLDDDASDDTPLIDRVYEEYADEEDARTEQASEAEPEVPEEFEPEFIFDDEDLPDAGTATFDTAGDDEDEREEFNDDDEFEPLADEDADRELPAFGNYAGDDDIKAPPPVPQRSFSARAGNDKAALHSYLADIEDDDALDPLDDEDALDFDEPVLLEAAPRRSRWVGFALLLANLALIALLAWQYADTNIERLSRSASFAPLLPYACRVLDCPAPQRAQPDLFVSEQLLVRSHPRYAQALEVNLVFRNDAPEAQPFPALELGFHDTSNRMVANRLFQPAEYLPPELQTSEMPAQSSFQVTLELVDPGSDAVNYTLGFRAP